jgi:hypothetical protein
MKIAINEESRKVDGYFELNSYVKSEISRGSRRWRRARSLVAFPSARDFRVPECQVRNLIAPELAIRYTRPEIRRGRSANLKVSVLIKMEAVCLLSGEISWLQS